MNKTLLLSGVAACLFVTNANAFNFQQYVSVKGLYNNMSNDDKYNIIDIHDDGRPTDVKSGTFDFDDNVWGVGLAYGVKTGAVRTELELNLHQDAKGYHPGEDRDEIKLENNSLMFNAYYDIDTGTKFTPYIGAGLGAVRLKTDAKATDHYYNRVVSYGKSKTNFAWQVGAGISYAAMDNIAVDFGYRYVDNGSYTFSNRYDPREGDTSREKLETTSHELYLGARYSF